MNEQNKARRSIATVLKDVEVEVEIDITAEDLLQIEPGDLAEALDLVGKTLVDDGKARAERLYMALERGDASALEDVREFLREIAGRIV